MQELLKDGENIDDLQCNNLKIIQNNKFFKFGIDAVLLANFVKTNKKNLKVVDLGTGTGIISILLTAKICVKKIYSIEIQEQVAEMARRSVQLNNLEETIDILNIDLKEADKHIEPGTIDVIVTNPPYQKNNSGIQNENEKRRISRHEICCNIEDICKISNQLLKDRGEFYMIHRPERLVDVMCALRKYKIEPKEIQFVQSNKEGAPVLFLVKAVKNGGKFLKTLKPIYVYE